MRSKIKQLKKVCSGIQQLVACNVGKVMGVQLGGDVTVSRDGGKVS